MLALFLLFCTPMFAAKLAYTSTAAGANNRSFWVATTGNDAAILIREAQSMVPLACGYQAAGQTLVIGCANPLYGGAEMMGNLQKLGYTVIGADIKVAFDPAITPVLLLQSFASSTTVSISDPGSWQASTDAPWLTMYRSDARSVGYLIAGTTSLYPRTATLTVSLSSGNVQLSVRQLGGSGGSPVYSFPVQNTTVGPLAGTNTATMTSSLLDSPWQATSNQPWLSIVTPNGVGSANISFAVAANASAANRSGVITVGNALFTVTQQAGQVTLLPTSAAVPQVSGSGGFAVSTNPPGLGWTATSSADWLTINPLNGTGNATLTYSFATNGTAATRTGVISVNGAQFTVSQIGIAITLSPLSATVVGTGAIGTFSLSLSVPGSQWTATSNASWLTVSPATGSGNATLTYTAAPNSSVLARSAYLSVNGTAGFLVTQTGLVGSVAISLSSATIQQNASSGTIAVTPTPSDYTGWTVTGAPSWLKLAFSGNTITWTAAANTTGLNRLATLDIGGETFSLIQTATGATNPLVSAVTNAASYGSGPIAPGEIVTLFGVLLGPVSPAGLLLSNGKVSTENAQTQVFFDSIPAPIIGAFTTQTSVQVPYGITGKASTSLTVRYQGVSSVPVLMTVSDSAFGLFSSDASGRGQSAALNADLSLNRSSNPVARGSVIVLYGTGEGQTSPAGMEGTTSPLMPPWLSPEKLVSVKIDGQAAVVEFVGAAPGEISGLLQINVRVPQSVTPGISVPVLVTVGTPGVTSFSTSQAGSTIAVK